MIMTIVVRVKLWRFSEKPHLLSNLCHVYGLDLVSKQEEGWFWRDRWQFEISGSESSLEKAFAYLIDAKLIGKDFPV